jgi:hypothetical protein
MGITKTIDVKVNAKQAKKDFDELSESIQLQEQYVSDLKLKIAEYEKSLYDLSGAKKIIREGEIKKLNSELKVEAAALRSLKTEAQGLNKVLKTQTNVRKAGTVKAVEFNETLLKNRDISGGLSKITGGLSSQLQAFGKLFVSVGKGIRASTLALSLFQKALIATGIGALVVAVGTLAANWDKIKVALGGVSKEQKKQLEDAKDLVSAQEEQYKNLTGTEESLKRQGKTEREITNLKIQQTNETITALEAQLEQQQTVKEEQTKIAQRNQAILEGILKFVSAPLDAIVKAFNFVTGKDVTLPSKGIASEIFNVEKISEEADEGIKETEKKLQELKNRRDGFLNKIQAEDDAEADKEKKKKDKVDQDAIDKEKARLESIADLREKYRKAQEDTEDITFQAKAEREQERALLELEALNATEEQKAELRTYYSGVIADAIIKDEQKIADEQEKLEQKKINIRNKAFDNAAKLAGEESRLGKAILVAKTILAAKENLIEVKKTLMKAKGAVADSSIDAAKSGSAIAAGTAETAKIGFPQNIPMLLAYAAQAVGVVAAIKSAVSKTKSVASSVGGVASGGAEIEAPQIPTAPPAFNIVGAGGVNQLATAIGEKEQAPIKTFVVSDEVSTAQELDRNIVTGAAIG